MSRTTIRYQELRVAPVAVVLTLLATIPALSVPRFTLLSGTRCSACHFNPQGSGLREELGWSAMNETGALSFDDVGMGGLAAETNGLFDGRAFWGFDLRGQSVRIGRPPNSERRFFPMQMAAHAAVVPVNELRLSGSYNFSTLKYKYPGQTPWTAAVQYQPNLRAPSIRVGYIQPSIGIRHDDHTVFVRRDISRPSMPLIAPDYNEIGAELTFEGTRWITLNAGAYGANNLAKATSSVDPTSISYSGRLVLWPQWFDEGINGMAGASILENTGLTMINGFAGFGLADKATFYGEGMYATKSGDTRIRNYMAQATWQLQTWLSLAMRYEWGQTEIPPSSLFHASSFIIGAEFFPIPSMELRPEYRYFENDEYRQGQYALQLHLFF